MELVVLYFQISYRLSFVTDYQDAIELPVRLNISSSGLVPTQQSGKQFSDYIPTHLHNNQVSRS